MGPKQRRCGVSPASELCGMARQSTLQLFGKQNTFGFLLAMRAMSLPHVRAWLVKHCVVSMAPQHRKSHPSLSLAWVGIAQCPLLTQSQCALLVASLCIAHCCNNGHRMCVTQARFSVSLVSTQEQEKEPCSSKFAVLVLWFCMPGSPVTVKAKGGPTKAKCNWHTDACANDVLSPP